MVVYTIELNVLIVLLNCCTIFCIESQYYTMQFLLLKHEYLYKLGRHMTQFKAVQINNVP